MVGRLISRDQSRHINIISQHLQREVIRVFHKKKKKKRTYMDIKKPLYERHRALRTFALIVSAYPYSVRKFTFHVIHRARAQNTKLNNDRPDGIVVIGFNDLGRSVTPVFLFGNRFYLQLSPHSPKMKKRSMWVVKTKFKISVHGTWNPAILRLQGAWNYDR